MEHLVEHGEAPDGIVSLAAIIVRRGYRITADQYQAMLALVEGSASAEFMPPELEAHIGNDGPN